MTSTPVSLLPLADTNIDCFVIMFDNLYVNNVHLHIGVLLGLLASIIQQTDQLTNYDS